MHRVRLAALAALVRGTAKADRIDAADGKRQQVACGKGRDLALVDELDRTGGCEVLPLGAAGDDLSPGLAVDPQSGQDLYAVRS